MLVTAILKYKPVTALINETNAMIGSTRLLDLPRYQTARLTVTLQDKKKSINRCVYPKRKPSANLNGSTARFGLRHHQTDKTDQTDHQY